MSTIAKNKVQENIQTAPTANEDGMWSFFGLTYALMIVTWGVLALFQVSVASTTNTEGQTSAAAMIAYLLGGFTPSIAAFIMVYRMDGRAGVRQLWKRFTQFRLGRKWYLVVFTIPAINFVVSSLVHITQGGNFASADPGELSATMVPIVITVFLFGPVSEEFGWRGFALDRVLARWGAVKGSLVLGLIWAFWHLPLFFIPGSGQQLTGDPAIMFPIYAVAVLGMSLIITWVYNNTDMSLWGATFFHFTMNFGTVILLMVSDATDAFAYKVNAVNFMLMAIVITLFTKLSKGQEG